MNFTRQCRPWPTSVFHLLEGGLLPDHVLPLVLPKGNRGRTGPLPTWPGEGVGWGVGWVGSLAYRSWTGRGGGVPAPPALCTKSHTCVKTFPSLVLRTWSVTIVTGFFQGLASSSSDTQRMWLSHFMMLIVCYWIEINHSIVKVLLKAFPIDSFDCDSKPTLISTFIAVISNVWPLD